CRDVCGRELRRLKICGVTARGGWWRQIQHRERLPLGEWFRVTQRDNNDCEQEERQERQRSGCRKEISRSRFDEIKNVAHFSFLQVGTNRKLFFLFRRKCSDPQRSQPRPLNSRVCDAMN